MNKAWVAEAQIRWQFQHVLWLLLDWPEEDQRRWTNDIWAPGHA